MAQTTYLIVEQRRKEPEGLPGILKELSRRYQLDIYQCRQRLVGRGLSLLARGKQETLEQISALLSDAGFVHWLTQPTTPGFAPQRIFGLKVDTDRIIFDCRTKQVEFNKGATVLAIFADLSGELAGKNVSQLLSSYAYRGRDDIRFLDDDKIHKLILQGKPVLDLYLLDDKNQVSDAVRILPGKFDPQGLGELATVSSRQNLDRIIRLTEKYAGNFRLQTDFGLVSLPGCTLSTDAIGSPETDRKNLISMSRYGWLMADLLRTGPIRPTLAETETTAEVAATLLQQNPALAANEQSDEFLSGPKELAREIEAAYAGEENVAESVPRTCPGLPVPPPPKSGSKWSHTGYWFGGFGAIVALLLIILPEMGDNRLLLKTAYHAFASGILPFTVSLIMFWYAFYFLRMKRQVENTPTSRIRSVAMGMVEVKGRAIRKFALVSPMSHSPCVFYRLTRYRRDRNNQWRVSSISSSDNVPFQLEDDTGRVEIDPADCRISAGSKQEGTPGQIGLSRLNDDSDDKWVEEVIVEGTLLYVLGYASVRQTEGPTLAEQKVEALRELKRNPDNLAQFDHDGDGHISEEEWDTARTAITDRIMHESLSNNRSRKKQEEHIVIGKKKGRPLIITETHSEDQLTARYGYYSIPLLLGAMAATGWAVHMLMAYSK